MIAVLKSVNPRQPASSHIATSAPRASIPRRWASRRDASNMPSATTSASMRATQVCTPRIFQPPAINQNNSGDLSEYHVPLTVGTSPARN